MEQSTKAFFRTQQEDPDNQTCVDDHSEGPQWASVSHGSYISLESSGVHRSLGVHVSFVRSITIDSWKPSQLKLMELGGNKKLRAFFQEQNIPDDMPIQQKYNTRAAEWYRKNLRSLAEGTEPPSPLPEGVGILPSVVEDKSATQLVSINRDAPSTGVGGYKIASQSSPSTCTPSRRRDRASSGAEEVLSRILGNEVGSKVSKGWWDTVGVVQNVANKAKVAVDKVKQAQDNGWRAVAGARHVDEVTRTTATSTTGLTTTTAYVQYDDGKKMLRNTTEKLGDVGLHSVRTDTSMPTRGIGGVEEESADASLPAPSWPDDDWGDWN